MEGNDGNISLCLLLVVVVVGLKGCQVAIVNLHFPHGSLQEECCGFFSFGSFPLGTYIPFRLSSRSFQEAPNPTMTTPTPKTIAILGPGGIQGASVLHYLLRSAPTTFTLRAITTRPGSSPSLPPLSSHPNLSTHHLPSPASIPHLTNFFTGCTAVFGNTNTLSPIYDGKPGSTTEIDALKAIVDASVEAKVGLLVLSCLPDVGALGKGSPDFVNKVEGMRYAKERARETGLRVVYVQLGWYMTNFVGDHDALVNPDDGVVEFKMQGLRQDKRGRFAIWFWQHSPGVAIGGS